MPIVFFMFLSKLRSIPSQIWSRIKRAPLWVWGVLLTAITFLGMFLRMKAAERARIAAEGAARSARASVRVASHEARAEIHLEQANALAEEREHIEMLTDAEIEHISNMDDEELTAWIRSDAAKRKKP